MQALNTDKSDVTLMHEEEAGNAEEAVSQMEADCQPVDLTIWVERVQMDDVLKNLDEKQQEIGALHKVQLEEKQQEIVALHKLLAGRDERITQLERERSQARTRGQLTNQALAATEAERRIAELEAEAHARDQQIATFREVVAEKDCAIVKLLAAQEDETNSTAGATDMFAETGSRRSSRSGEVTSNPTPAPPAEHSRGMLSSSAALDNQEQSSSVVQRNIHCDSSVRSVSPVRIVAPVRDENGKPLSKPQARIEFPTAAIGSCIQRMQVSHPMRIASPVVVHRQGTSPIMPMQAAPSPLSQARQTSMPNVMTQAPTSPLLNSDRGRAREVAPQRAALRLASPTRVYVEPHSPVRTVVGGACAAWQCVREPSPIEARMRVSSPPRTLPARATDSSALTRSTQRLAVVEAAMERQRRRQEHARLLVGELQRELSALGVV